MDRILNAEGIAASIQISKLLEVPTGDTVFDNLVLLKNITEETISIKILMPNTDTYITTTLYPGWNVEMVKAIKDVKPNTLQYGY